MKRDLDLPAMPLVEHLEHGGKTIAVIVRREFSQPGIRFFTPDTFSQQIGYMNRPAGYEIAPHVHLPVRREVQYTNEALFIRSGRLRVDFYSDEQAYLESTILEAGDVVLLVQGGHGFEMLEATEIIEIKQGPYAGDRDKQRFDGVSADRVQLRASALGLRQGAQR
jgi:mannose-6-phosphate isomerase-like protein (cupin superfamily)